MTSYFEDFKKYMKKRLRILVSLVKNIMIDVDHTFVQAKIPRVRWLRPLGYEINVDEASTTITTLLAEEVEKDSKAFGNYELA